MEQNTNQFSELINMIKEASGEKETKGIAIKEINNNLVYGEMVAGYIHNPIQLSISNKDNFCQNLYDVLVSEFGEGLTPAYSYSDGQYTYFMYLGDNVLIFFPNEYKYQNWIHNQVQIDRENLETKKQKR